MTDLVMVTWDRLHYTKIAVQGLKMQTNKDFKLTIVDNGSSDGTVEYLKELDEPWIKVILLGENKGLSYATNLAFKDSTAEFIGRVDNDTFVQPDWHERLVTAHRAYDNFGFIGGMHFFPYHLADISPRITSHNGIEIWEKPYIGGCSFIIKKKDYDRFGEIGSGVEYHSKVMGLTEYQMSYSDSGLINGYLYPFIWVDHMEHSNSPRHISTNEYSDYTFRTRGLGSLDYSNIFDRDSHYYLSLNTQ